MITKIRKWGNSQGIYLPRQVIEDARLSVGDAVDVTVRDGAIVISPVKRIRRRYDLQELVSRIPEDYKADECDWGRPVGRETW